MLNAAIGGCATCLTSGVSVPGVTAPGLPVPQAPALDISIGGPVFPSFDKPGMPNFILGLFLGTLAGVTFVLKFIPPDPANLPSPPGMPLFLDAFLGGVNLPKIAGFDPSGAVNLILAAVKMIFKFFTQIILSIINLSPAVPTLGFAIKIFSSIAADLGMAFKADCIPKAFFGVIKALLPL